MFNQTIPKQKRPFLGLKVHSFTQNMRGEINWILRLDIFVVALINYRRQFTIKTKGSSFTDLMVK
jgi:hypothetical protein